MIRKVREGIGTPCFSRKLNGWEMKRVEAFLLRPQGKIVRRDEEDRMK